MFSKILVVTVIVAAAYWYWSGPYQQLTNPDQDKRLEANAKNMRECLRGLNYKAGATGENVGDPEEICATRYNLYQYEGQWYSYDDARPE